MKSAFKVLYCLISKDIYIKNINEKLLKRLSACKIVGVRERNRPYYHIYKYIRKDIKTPFHKWQRNMVLTNGRLK